MKGTMWMLAWWMTLQLCSSQKIGLDDAFQVSADEFRKLEDRVDGLTKIIVTLGKQIISLQLFVEERIRSEGGSGLKQVRVTRTGTSSYFTPGYINKGFVSIHDHSNYRETLGLGEFIAVINGVEFRTRHNDYKLNMPSRNNATLHAVEPVPLPPVPPDVLKQPTVEEQVNMMKRYFQAFSKQNYTELDYRPYFRPVICYVEGAWLKDDKMAELFQSDRHQLEAGSWEELQQQIRYTSYTGTGDLKENFAFLPRTIISVNETTGIPLIAQWHYRILCHPIREDIPLSYFRQQDDLAFRKTLQRSKERVRDTRGARFKLSEFDTERFTDFTYLDEIMSQVPGVNNYNNTFMNEETFGMELLSRQFPNKTKLNTIFYHRIMTTSKNNAMGISTLSRGFSDPSLFVAETNQSQVAPLEFRKCFTKSNCTIRSSRFTFAIPLEIIILTPLLSWNPYNLSLWTSREVFANGRKGDTKDPAKAYNGTSADSFYYITPASFYGRSSDDDKDPADTVQGQVGVLDQNGKICKTVASGTSIMTSNIEGAGSIRLRYPIAPLHVEGNTIWKELEVVKQMLVPTQPVPAAQTSAVRQAVKADQVYSIQLQTTPINGAHSHEFDLTEREYTSVRNGSVLIVTTSVANDHAHSLEVWRNPITKELEYKSCDKQAECWDQHAKKLIILSPQK